MPATSRSRRDFALSALATLMAAAAAVLALAVPLSTGLFTDRPPSGADAMGMVVLVIAAILAALLMLAASVCLLVAGRLAWIGSRPWLGLPATFGAGIAAAVALVMWVERAGAWIVPAGIVFGAIAPLVACGLLILAAWLPPARMTALVWVGPAAKLVAAAALFAAACCLIGLFA